MSTQHSYVLQRPITPQTGQELVGIISSFYNLVVPYVEQFHSKPNSETFLALLQRINSQLDSILKACNAAPPHIFAEPVTFNTVQYPNLLCFLVSHSYFVEKTITSPIVQGEALLQQNPPLIPNLHDLLVKKCTSKLKAAGYTNSLKHALTLALQLNSSEMPCLLEALGTHALTCSDPYTYLPVTTTPNRCLVFNPFNVDLALNSHGDVPLYYPNPLAQLLAQDNIEGRCCAIIDLIETLISYILNHPDQINQIHLLLDMKCWYAGNTWTLRNLITDVINTDDVLRGTLIKQFSPDLVLSEEYNGLLKECFPNLILAKHLTLSEKVEQNPPKSLKKISATPCKSRTNEDNHGL